MRLSSVTIIAATFAVAAGLSLVAASFSVDVIEDSSEYGVRDALDQKEMNWAEVHADGLKVFLTGTAPSEAVRFKALTAAGTVVDAARVIDEMEVRDSKTLAPPRFSIEILRNDSGISLIGLIPVETDRDALIKKLTKLADDLPVTDLLETAEYPVPDGWQDALDYAMRALKTLPRSKISVAADRVAITAMSDSESQKRTLESELSRKLPSGVTLALNISAPRPVITPFTLRFLIDDDGARFDACSADTPAAKDRILAAAVAAGQEGKITCTIGLGVPSPNWAKAAEESIAALAAIGKGTVTIADADISLIAAQGTDPALFDRTIGALENSLPEVFALHAVLPEPEDKSAAGPPEFTATLSPEGLLQMRGRIGDELSRDTAVSYAKARFGSDTIHMSARLDADLPAQWPIRVLAGLEALSFLSNGAITVTPDNITVMGNTGDPEANAKIAKLLADKLREGAVYSIDVTYLKKLDPVAGLPTPDECEAEIGEILKARKINFEPSSDTPVAEARVIIDDIAAILKRCGDLRLEIGGHTDSQGSETMNENLSQRRAQAVLNALRERRVLTGSITAKGYGESTPIADNKTEDGRDANRRIEIKLIRPEPIPETETTLESVEQTVEEAQTESDSAQPADPTDPAQTSPADDAEGQSNEQN